MKQLKRMLFLFPLLLTSQTVLASGWGDYRLDIAPGYTIIRNNSFEVGLTNNSVVYFPKRGGRSGPISGYTVSPTHIFFRTTGQKPRNKFTGDRIILADTAIEYFFVVDRSNGSLVGPLTAAEFSADPNASTLVSPNWIAIEQPQSERIFFTIAAVMVGGLIVLVGLVIFVVYRAERAPQVDASSNV